MRFLEERKAAELTRQSEELKTALLASLGHDFRTPLTAIRVAASNLKALPDGSRGRDGLHHLPFLAVGAPKVGVMMQLDVVARRPKGPR